MRAVKNDREQSIHALTEARTLHFRAIFGLVRIFHEARCARREKCKETACVGPIVPAQTVGSKFRRYASELASASVHLQAQNIALSGNIQANKCMDALANSEAQRRNLEPTVCVGTTSIARFVKNRD